MALTLKDFSTGPSDNRLICIVKRGDTKALCGANMDDAIKTTRVCPKCRSLQREAMWTQEGNRG